MLFRSYTPAPLSDFISDFWLYDDYAPPHFKERILPSGTIELVINLRDDELRIHDRVGPRLCERFSGAVVSGTYGGFFVIDTAQETSLMGVHFKPGRVNFFQYGSRLPWKNRPDDTRARRKMNDGYCQRPLHGR